MKSNIWNVYNMIPRLFNKRLEGTQQTEYICMIVM